MKHFQRFNSIRDYIYIHKWMDRRRNIGLSVSQFFSVLFRLYNRNLNASQQMYWLLTAI